MNILEVQDLCKTYGKGEAADSGNHCRPADGAGNAASDHLSGWPSRCG